MGFLGNIFGGGNKTDWKQVEKVMLEVDDGLSLEFSYEEAAAWRRIKGDFDRLNTSDFKRSRSSANFTGSIVKAYEMKVRGLRSTAQFLEEANRIVKEAMIIAFGANVTGSSIKHADEEILIKLIKDMNSGKFGNAELVGSERLATALNDLLDELSQQYEAGKVRGTILKEADQNQLKTLLMGKEEAKAFKWVKGLANSLHMGTYTASVAGIPAPATASKILDAKLAEIDALITEQASKIEAEQEKLTGINQEIAEKDAFLDEIAEDLSRDYEYEQKMNEITALQNNIGWITNSIDKYSNVRDGLTSMKLMIGNLLSGSNTPEMVKWLEDLLSARSADFTSADSLQKMLDILSKRIEKEKASNERISVSGPQRMASVTAQGNAAGSKTLADREARLRRKQAQAAAQAELGALDAGMGESNTSGNDVPVDVNRKMHFE